MFLFLSKLLFPCRCPICKQVITPNTPTCNACADYLNIKPHKQILSNGCVCVSAFRHDGVWRRAVLNYKFYGNRQYYIQFSLILKYIIEDVYPEIKFDVYTSVPSHQEKIKARGFDQVMILAKETARLQKCVYKQLLYQTKNNKFQHELSSEERIANVADIYKCCDADFVKGKTILLFDDIITTGATMLEASKELYQAGAEKVYCITINW